MYHTRAVWPDELDSFDIINVRPDHSDQFDDQVSLL